ncbi:hypothetical protein [Micromonospora taraxaci]|uniref:hypothetical protein n=1 Tax=Micromonospora taraxaci TaxID=1316803 RepID=UPI0033BD7CBB
MGNNVATRVLLLIIAISAAISIGLTTGWVTWEIEQSVGKALIAGGAGFGGSLALSITALNFVLKREA